AAGFTINGVPSNNQYVEATGSIAHIAAAFGVNLGQYHVKGKVLRSADRNLSVPASLAGIVSGVIGVDQALSLLHPLNTTGNNAPGTSPAASASPRKGIPLPGGFRNAPPCSAYWAQATATIPNYPPYGTKVPYAPCGYKPPQLRAAYGFDSVVSKGVDGTGTTVAIVDAFASPTILADAQTYASRNDPTHPLTTKQFKQLVFKPTHSLIGPCDASGWFGEETLDVEAVHAMAPGANILFVGGSDCTSISLDKAVNAIVADHLAQIVSNSYGDLGEDIPADEVSAFTNIAVQAGMEGIGLYFSSGDNGDESTTLKSPSADFSASSPWVTAVGGTSIGIGADGHRVLETGWETTKSTLKKNGKWKPPTPDAFLYGSGGGTSRLFAEPAYQEGVVPDALTRVNQVPGRHGRVVPDVSLDGDPNTGMLVGQTQVFPEGTKYDEYRIGGTSLSSPLFAGIMALADQNSGVAHGFVNPMLYDNAGTAAFNDVTHVKAADVRVDYLNGIDATNGTVVSIRGFDFQGLTIKTTPGYDNVTGLGTPNGKSFLARL
ncbi:MAG: hypothetical protein JWL83_2537, partial [Actinomycetia bacterium]|nr:hypothetical protein [Actinomycetes bacterium]